MHIQYILCVFVLLGCEFNAVKPAPNAVLYWLPEMDGFGLLPASSISLQQTHTHTHILILSHCDNTNSLPQSVHVCMRVKGQRVGILMILFLMFCVHVCPPVCIHCSVSACFAHMCVLCLLASFYSHQQ